MSLFTYSAMSKRNYQQLSHMLLQGNLRAGGHCWPTFTAAGSSPKAAEPNLWLTQGWRCEGTQCLTLHTRGSTRSLITEPRNHREATAAAAAKGELGRGESQRGSKPEVSRFGVTAVPAQPPPTPRQPPVGTAQLQGCGTSALCSLHPGAPPCTAPHPTHNEHKDSQQLSQALSCQLVLDAEQRSDPPHEGHVAHGTGRTRAAAAAPAASLPDFMSPGLGWVITLRLYTNQGHVLQLGDAWQRPESRMGPWAAAASPLPPIPEISSPTQSCLPHILMWEVPIWRPLVPCQLLARPRPQAALMKSPWKGSQALRAPRRGVNVALGR